MAKAVAGYTPSQVQGGTINSSANAALLLQGQFVGWDSSGTIKLADYRAAQGPIVAAGVLLQGAVRKDPLGNVLATGSQVSYVMGAAKLVGMTDRAGAALTPGSIYYLSSGGEVTKVKQAATTSDIDQMVGLAMSASELQLLLGQPIVHA